MGKGEVDISRYSSNYRVGEGVWWSKDRKHTFKHLRGIIEEEIDLNKSDWIVNSIGLLLP